jgi:16S rRNA (uracil1498-N3)-methyltransferase
MSRRFFCDHVATSGKTLLEGPEAHHLAHVMRLGAGEPVVLFDGSGREFAAVVRRVSRAHVELEVTGWETVDRELPWPVVLAVALPKGDRQRWLVEKAVELGVSRLTPLRTERGVADAGSALARLRRGVIEASKQCGRNKLMQIDEPEHAEAFFRDAPVAALRLIALPEPDSPPKAAWLASQPGAARIVAIGPEGGFTASESAAALSAGWQPISLGPRVLRTETAAVALAAVVGLPTR